MSAGRPRALDLIRCGVLVLTFPAFAALSAAAQPQTVTALADQSLRTQTTVFEIVVKFKEADRTKAIIDAFWSRPQVAQDRFDDFKRAYPLLESASLIRVTYSGELVLAFPCNENSTDRRMKAARDLAARLALLPDISYAEPDLTFLTLTPPVR